jgi:hypothetical protein
MKEYVFPSLCHLGFQKLMREFANISFISELIVPKTMTGPITFFALTAHQTPNTSLCSASLVLIWNFLPTIIG